MNIRIKNCLWLLAICFAFGLLLSHNIYAQKSVKQKKSKFGVGAQKGETTHRGNNVSEKLFFDGITALLKGNAEGALIAFKSCVSSNPQNDAAYYEMAKLYLDSQDLEQGAEAAKIAAQLDENNKWYQLLYAETLAAKGDLAESAAIYKKLIARSPDNFEYYFDLAYVLVRSAKFQEAIDAYNELEKNVGVIEEISLQKQRLYTQLNNTTKAIEELEKLAGSDPQEPRYRQKLAELYIANGMKEKALAMYQKMLELDPNNPEARLAMAEYYLMQGEKAKYYDELQKAFVNPNLPVSTKARLLEGAIGKESPDTSARNTIAQLVKTVVTVHPDEVLSHILHGDWLHTNKKMLEAIAAYKKALQIDAKHFEVWQQVLYLESESNMFDDLIKDSKAAIELFPEQALPYYLNGLANNVRKNYDAAIKSLKKVVLMSADNPQLAVQTYSLLGDAYNSTKDYENSDKSFEKALVISPANATVLNNYSYFLSLRKNNLEKAAQMSLKSNELEANNPSYLDTYAWILFQQEKYTDALTWIEKALQHGGSQSGTVLEHYGDILFKNGKTDVALQQWQLAKQKGETSELLDKKIRDKKLW